MLVESMSSRPSPSPRAPPRPPPRVTRNASVDEPTAVDGEATAKAAGAGAAADVVERATDNDVPASSLAANPDDDDATKGEWLFKQDDLVLGPVSAIVLVERIKTGALSADTPIARDGQAFRPMKLVALFRDAYTETQERKRRAEDERRYNAAVRRARALRLAIVFCILSAPAAAGAFAGYTVMTLRPWDDTPAMIAKMPPLVDLPPRPPTVKVAVAADQDRPAATDGDSTSTKPDDKADAPDRHEARRGGRGNDRNDRRDDKADAKGDAKGDTKGDRAADEKPQAFVKELSNEQAVAPLKDSAVRSELGACFKAEVEANPDMPAQLVLAYTITEDGRAANVQLENRELRGRPVQECVKKALARARWPRFEGERKNVSVPFNIRKPPKPAGGAVTGASR